jgi:hypothetical protein
MIRFVLSKDHQAMLNRCEVSEDLRLCCEKLKKSVTGLKKNAGKDIPLAIVKVEADTIIPRTNGASTAWKLWTDVSPEDLEYFSICVPNANKDDSVVTLIHDRKYCSCDYERCRIRPSVNNVVSLLLFVGSFVMLYRSIANNSLFDSVKKAAVGGNYNGQFTVFLWAFAAVYTVHLVRVYVSTLMIESDPTFFATDIAALDSAWWKRAGELLFRFFVVLSVGVSVWHGFGWAPFAATFFGKALWGAYFSKFLRIFFALLLWDVWMSWFSGGLRGRRMRQSFFINDLVGFIAVLFLVLLEIYPGWFESWFLGVFFMLSCLMLIGFVSLVFGFAVEANRKMYVSFFRQEWRRWHLGIPCSAECPILKRQTGAAVAESAGEV